eukprot:CAMPEP_0171636086 /NCGR_PEP_ID=MMETSP0990-20121206/27151_1 /TAXON_ID=483369 /ORGANISM="non described non described, Strain CCMP2098" /LENGTH=141 /DNA_ID=CAMNT_0012208051 /DNA_START=134 /DNA_END=559 /DNA_ORIENTATION=+
MAPTIALDQKRRDAGKALNECLFSYYYGTFCMLFVVGTPISIKLKNYWPAVTAGMLGTLIDYTYASYYGCAPQFEAYRLAAGADSTPKLGMQGPVRKTYYSWSGQIPPPAPPTQIALEEPSFTSKTDDMSNSDFGASNRES